MPKVYVQLVTGQFIPDKHNKLKKHDPGEWVQVGKHMARQWLCSGEATLPDIKKADSIVAGDLEDAGVCAIGTEDGTHELNRRFDLPVVVRDWPELPYGRTLVWYPRGYDLDVRQGVMGLTLLDAQDGYDAWDMAAMLATSNPMAKDIGHAPDRRRLEKLVGDLRLPVYQTKVVWLRQSRKARSFVNEWVRVMRDGVEERLAFLEAWYKVKPSIYTLEADWMYPWWKR
jgi:hypothetical protein